METERSDQLRVVLGVALASIVVGGSLDLIMDQPDDWMSLHVVFETLMIAGAMVMATTLWFGWWKTAGEADELRRSLEVRREERDRWRESAQQALDGLSHAMNMQFGEWQLTPAEREVALYLLKGYSHKAIARDTERSAQTVRQHAASVYRKAGLAGRAQLSAFFLEDLMLPRDGEGR